MLERIRGVKNARDVVYQRLSQVKSFLAQESPPRLSESDTKANFIEPIITALGWEGIGVVTREYYVRNSQEFIDYVMRGPEGRLLLAIEAKPLRTDLSDKHAAQLIQYCAVEGIEWAALTNGRELQFFNTFLKPDLAAKRVLQLDLLAYNTDEEFDALFGQIWQLSRESMTKPKGIRTWLNQLRLDTALRSVLLDPSSSTNRYLRRFLSDQDISANSQEVAQWFRTHLSSPITVLPPGGRGYGDSPGPEPENSHKHGDEEDFLTAISTVWGATDFSTTLCLALRKAIENAIPDVKWRTTKYYVAADVNGETFLAVRLRSRSIVVGLTLDPTRTSPRFNDAPREFNWKRITKTLNVNSKTEIDSALLALIDEARAYAGKGGRKVPDPTPGHGPRFYGVTVSDLISSRLLAPGTQIVLVGNGNRDIARAEITQSGEILWNGRRYRSLSDRVFSPLLGRKSFNGWTHWFAEFPGRREQLSHIRDRYLAMQEQNTGSDQKAG